MSALEEVGSFFDVPVDIDLVLDRKIMTISQILELDVGSLIRLTRPAGDNVDLYLGGVLLGGGEIVVLQTALAARITGFHTEG